MLQFPKTVMMSKVDNEYVLMDTRNGEYYGLNATGTKMVELLFEHQDRDTVVSIMVETYDAPMEQIRADLENLLKELRERKLIKEKKGDR